MGHYFTGLPATGIATPVAKTWNGTRWRAVGVKLPPGASGGSLYGVACPARAYCVAAGDVIYRHTGKAPTEVVRALAEVWNGTAWKPVLPPAGANSLFDAVTCRSVKSCIAVGAGSAVGGIGGLLADSWNGRTWTADKVPPPTPKESGFLNGVSCATASFCVAAGAVFPGRNGPETPLLEGWNGRRWAAMTPATPATRAQTAVDAVSCPTTDSCVAVGAGIARAGSVSYADAWNGRRWTLTRAVPWPRGTDDPWLYGVSCRAASRCVAVGLTDWDPASNGGLSGHAAAASWNGKSWTPSKVTVPGKHVVSAFQGVACLPGTRVLCTAAGEWGRLNTGVSSPLTGRWHGRRWRVTAFGR